MGGRRQRIPETWLLTYSPVTMEEPQSVEVNGTSTDLTGLIPGAEYVFTLADPSGSMLGGTYEITAETAEAVLYEDHDFGGIFIGLYEKPDIVWDVQYLGEVKDTFAVGTPIICVIQPTATPQVPGNAGGNRGAPHHPGQRWKSRRRQRNCHILLERHVAKRCLRRRHRRDAGHPRFLQNGTLLQQRAPSHRRIHHGIISRNKNRHPEMGCPIYFIGPASRLRRVI